MIPEKELERIYKIVEQFGGEQKPTLKAKLVNLISRHDRDLKTRLANKIDEV